MDHIPHSLFRPLKFGRIEMHEPVGELGVGFQGALQKIIGDIAKLAVFQCGGGDRIMVDAAQTTMSQYISRGGKAKDEVFLLLPLHVNLDMTFIEEKDTFYFLAFPEYGFAFFYGQGGLF